MKYFLTVVFFASVGLLFANPVDTIPNDSILVPVSYVLKSAETIKTQRDSLEFYRKYTDELVSRNTTYQSLVNTQTAEMILLNRRIEISDGIVDRYQMQVKPERRKWYEEPMLHYVGGIATAWLSSVIIKNIK